MFNSVKITRHYTGLRTTDHYGNSIEVRPADYVAQNAVGPFMGDSILARETYVPGEFAAKGIGGLEARFLKR